MERKSSFRRGAHEPGGSPWTSSNLCGMGTGKPLEAHPEHNAQMVEGGWQLEK